MTAGKFVYSPPNPHFCNWLHVDEVHLHVASLAFAVTSTKGGKKTGLANWWSFWPEAKTAESKLVTGGAKGENLDAASG